jgi:hypothetical protein
MSTPTSSEDGAAVPPSDASFFEGVRPDPAAVRSEAYVPRPITNKAKTREEQEARYILEKAGINPNDPTAAARLSAVTTTGESAKASLTAYVNEVFDRIKYMEGLYKEAFATVPQNQPAASFYSLVHEHLAEVFARYATLGTFTRPASPASTEEAAQPVSIPRGLAGMSSALAAAQAGIFEDNNDKEPA